METKQTLNLSYEFSGSLFEKYRNGEWWCNDFDTLQECLDDIMNEIIEGNEVNVNIDFKGMHFGTRN